jgi:BirA family biotin operon repressor/biotin-[acetyl-CoA-carboxylase] ligase
VKEKILNLLKGAEDFLSGQELSEQFGVSRTAVWKAIRQLEDEGYAIEAVRNKGYRLVAEPDVLSVEKIKKSLHTSWAGNEIQVLDVVDSTNNMAKRCAEEGAGHGLLIIGDQQTAGKGRRGRAWDSKKGEGIFMTLLLKPDLEPGNASMLTLVMALAVRRALEHVANLSASIKWPNDIICNGKKVCGILTEMSAQMDYINHIVIGVGINVHNETFLPEVENVATSIYQQTGVHIVRTELVAEVLNCFEYYYEQFMTTQDLCSLVEEYNQYLINCDRKVLVLDAKHTYTGTALGINSSGELQVLTEDGIRNVASGEVSVRGVYGYV